MKKFNLYQALEGGRVITRKGIRVHLLPYSGNGRLHGVLDQDETVIPTWNINGSYWNEESEYDLFLMEDET